jgi:hypothetical protein
MTLRADDGHRHRAKSFRGADIFGYAGGAPTHHDKQNNQANKKQSSK